MMIQACKKYIQTQAKRWLESYIGGIGYAEMVPFSCLLSFEFLAAKKCGNFKN